MGIECERRFKVDPNILSAIEDMACNTRDLVQGYITTDALRVVRVRVDTQALKAWLTIKGKKVGCIASEFEYEIPHADGLELLRLTECSVRKTRYDIECDGYVWEVDVFKDECQGLVIAELETSNEYAFPIDLPPWIREEITNDRKYSNLALAQHPLQS